MTTLPPVDFSTPQGIQEFTGRTATQQREALAQPQGRDALIAAARARLAEGGFRAGQGNAGRDTVLTQALLSAVAPDSNLRVDGRFGDARGSRRTLDTLLRVQGQIDVNDGVAGDNFLRAAVARLENGQTVNAPPTPGHPPRQTGVQLRRTLANAETTARRTAAASEYQRTGDERQVRAADSAMQQRVAGAASREEGPRREEYSRIAADVNGAQRDQINGRADAVIKGLTEGQTPEQGRGRVLDYLRSEGDHSRVLARLSTNQEQWNALRTEAAGSHQGLTPGTLRTLAGTTNPPADGPERNTYRQLRDAAIAGTQPPARLPAADIQYLLRENPTPAGTARLAAERAAGNGEVTSAATGAVRDLVSNGRYAEAAALVRQLHGELPPNARPGQLSGQTVAQARLANDVAHGVMTGDLTDDQRIGFYRAMATPPQDRNGPQGPNPIFATMPDQQYQAFERSVQGSSTPRQRTPRYIGDIRMFTGVQRNLGLRLSDAGAPAR